MRFFKNICYFAKKTLSRFRSYLKPLKRKMKQKWKHENNAKSEEKRKLQQWIFGCTPPRKTCLVSCCVAPGHQYLPNKCSTNGIWQLDRVSGTQRMLVAEVARIHILDPLTPQEHLVYQEVVVAVCFDWTQCSKNVCNSSNTCTSHVSGYCKRKQYVKTKI